MKSYDILVIGGGSGGVRTARLAAGKGLATAIVEGRHWGGTCVNLGCIPKKFMVFAADYRENFDLATDYGWQSGAKDFHWNKLRELLRAETTRLQRVYCRLLKESGVDLIDGIASFVSPTEVQVGKRSYKAQKIVLATGGRPFIANIPGKEHVLSSDDIFSLPSLPKRIVIYGGGYIAVEFACILAGLGSEVSLVHRSERILRQLDEELVNFALSEMRKGVRPILNTQLAAIEKTSTGTYRVRLKNSVQGIPPSPPEIEADAVLFAVGRTPNTDSLNLEKAGVELTARGAVAVDENYASSQRHIFAVGDLIAKKALTPVAIAEAKALVDSDFGEKNTALLDYDAVPTAVFCRPELATLGITEELMYQRGGGEVYKRSFIPMKQMFSRRPSRFFIKILCENNRGRLLGIHIAGEEAGEILQGFAAAFTAGLHKKHLDETLGIHPTIAEEFFSLR